MPSGRRNSSSNISPGWVGGRFMRRMSTTGLVVVLTAHLRCVCAFELKRDSVLLLDSDAVAARLAAATRLRKRGSVAMLLSALPAAACVESQEVRLLPLLAQGLGLFDGAVAVDPRREVPGAGARGEVPDAGDRPEEFWIARLPPRRVLHLGDVAELADRHYSSRSRKRRRRASASPQSFGRMVPLFILSLIHISEPTRLGMI